MLKISFPFKFISKSRLGKIYRPYAIFPVFSKLNKKWIQIEMVVDSGADYSLFPKKYAGILGINLDTECFAEKTLGVGGSETVYQYKGLPIKIGKLTMKIPVGFLDRDDIPVLLGRLGFIEKFKLTFYNFTSTFETK